MVEIKFLTDRMLGKLTTWLRISGYDTLNISDLNVAGDEDDFMLNNFTDRILLTKDKVLYYKCIKNGRKAFLITSNDLAEQMRETKKLGVKFQLVMDRCSVCNSILRKPRKEEAIEVIKREKLSENLLGIDLWYCEKCKKLYWMGGHWKNMLRFLRKVEK